MFNKNNAGWESGYGCIFNIFMIYIYIIFVYMIFSSDLIDTYRQCLFLPVYTYIFIYTQIYIYIFSVSRKRCFTGRLPKNALQSVQQRVMRHYPRCRSHERRVLSDPATIWVWPGVVPTPEIWRIDTKHDGLEDVFPLRYGYVWVSMSYYFFGGVTLPCFDLDQTKSKLVSNHNTSGACFLVRFRFVFPPIDRGSICVSIKYRAWCLLSQSQRSLLLRGGPASHAVSYTVTP